MAGVILSEEALLNAIARDMQHICQAMHAVASSTTMSYALKKEEMQVNEQDPRQTNCAPNCTVPDLNYP